LTSLGFPLLAFRSSPESHHSVAVAAGTFIRPYTQQLPPVRSLPLRRLSNSGQPLTPGLTNPGLRCLLSVSHALKASIRPLSPGLISCRSRPWGSPFRADFHSPSGTLFRAPYPHAVNASSGLRLGLSPLLTRYLGRVWPSVVSAPDEAALHSMRPTPGSSSR